MSERLERLVSEQALRTPEACAIVENDARVSYRELDLRSNQVANALLAQGFRARDRACLLVPKSIDAVVSVLGVLKAGGTYVPMDVQNPVARLTRLFCTCEPCWLIARPDSAQLVARCRDELDPAAITGTYWLGEIPHGSPAGQRALSTRDVDAAAHAAPPSPASSDDLAYILFTSGSTGEPKGVSITHDNIVHFISWAGSHFGLGREDRISGQSPMHFDGSVWDIFSALSRGAELHLVPGEATLLPTSTAAFIRESKLTQWASVPTVLTRMANRDVVGMNDFPELRRVFWYGEPFSLPALRYWMDRLPHVEFSNVYGPTETTVGSSYHTLRSYPHTDEPIPIGTAIPGKPLAVFDEHGQPAAPDVVGELYIGGTGVSPGYWRDPVKTADLFVEVPPGSGARWYRTGDLARVDADGRFHFHGRADRQVKARGNRIELDEIAVALEAVNGLAASAIVAMAADERDGTHICAAYVPAPDAGWTPALLRKELARKVPSYMLPTRWLELETIPTNSIGKTDHLALAQRFLAEERSSAR